MSKIAVVYWSGTGNTEAMAEEVANGAKAAGAEVESFTTDDFAADKMNDYDAVAFGCPAMGDEVLEEDEFEPLFEDCKAKLSGKKIALFGSYGWGDGEWMRNWKKTAKQQVQYLPVTRLSVMMNQMMTQKKLARTLEKHLHK